MLESIVDKIFLGIIDKSFLNNIIELINKKVPLLKSLVFYIKLSNFQFLLTNPRIIIMKYIAILIILYQSAYQNNSNDNLLCIAFYFYLVGIHIDGITLLNYLGLLVLYNVL